MLGIRVLGIWVLSMWALGILVFCAWVLVYADICGGVAGTLRRLGGCQQPSGAGTGWNRPQPDSERQSRCIPVFVSFVMEAG